MAGREFKIKKGLIIYSEGVDDVVLDVQGSQGQLFSVTDRLTGLLHSVNDISGIPIMEVYSDDRILMGTYGANALQVSGSTVRMPNLVTASAYSGILVSENGDIKQVTSITTIGGEPAFTKGSLVQGAGITLSGTLTNRLVGSGDVTVAHLDTSAQSSVSNTNGNVIQSITLDTYGHITALTSTDLDTRYSLTSHNHTLDSLSNVTITSNTNGEILRWSGTAWINNTLAEAGIQPTITAAALTKTDDTNVTLTLGGSPSTALLAATSLTLGWSGQLAVSRGGTGASTLTGVLIGNGTSAVTGVSGSASQLLRRNAGNTAYEFFTHDFINQAGARSAISLTTTGTSGAATYSSATGVLNIPQYQAALTNPVTGTGTAAQVAFWNGTATVTGDSGLTWDNTSKILQLRDSAGTNIHYIYSSGGNLILSRPNSTAEAISIRGGNNELWVRGSARLNHTGVNFEISNQVSGSLSLATTAGNGNILLSTNGSGRVGLDNTAPLARLHIGGDLPVALANETLSVEKTYTNSGESYGLGIDTYVFSSSPFYRVVDFVAFSETQASARPSIMRFFTQASTSNGVPTEVMRLSVNQNLLLGTVSDSGDKLRVNGTVRLDTVTNATGDFVRIDANNVLRRRTAAETLTDIGALPSTSISIASGQVAFGTGVNTVGGDAGLTWDNVNKRLNVVKTDTNTAIRLITTDNTPNNFGRIEWKNDHLTSYPGIAAAISSAIGTFGGEPYLSFFTNTTTTSVGALVERMRITSAGNVGIGITNPTSILHLASNSNTDILARGYSNTSSLAGALILGKARGTLSSPLAISLSDRLGTLVFSGYNGSVFVNSTAIIGFASENYSASANGSYLSFETTSNGGTTRTEKVRITHDGQFWIGTTSGTNTLDVNGTARIRTVNNLGTAATEFLTQDALGVITKRTAAQLLSDIGAQADLDIISLAELNTGTATTERSVNSKNLNDWLSGKLSGANGYTEESLTYVASNTFTLSQSNPMAINVYIHGQRKRPGLDYTVSGNQITFLDTLQASFDIKVTYFYSIPGTGLSGSGTTNYVPKWSSTTAFTNSQIFDNGTSIGVNTLNTGSRFSIATLNNTLGFQILNEAGNTTVRFRNAGTPSRGELYLDNNGSNTVFITAVGASYINGGNLLVGTVTDGGQRLQVSGSGIVTGTLEVDTINNGTGDFVTVSAGGILTRRTATEVRSDIGATTVGSNLFQLTNPSAVTFLRVNADNTVSALSATDFRTAIGAGTSSTTGTVTSVGGTGTVSGLSLSGTVTTSGSLTLSGTLAVAASNFSSQTANTFLAAPNGSAGVPTFRTIVAADVPTLNQNTTGTAAGLSSTLVVGSGGTGATTLTGVVIGNGTSAMTGVAGTASQILRRNAGNTAYEFFTIAGSDVTGASLTATNDTNVTITLGGTPATSLLRAASLTLGWTGTLAIARGGTGLSALGTANQLLRVNAGATALEYFTPSFLTAAITSLNGLTAATQTFTNDTNVTITSATSTHTIGWSGQLAVSRGGTGASTLTGVLIGNGTSAVTAVAGTASQILRRNAGNTAYEFFTIAGSDITGAALTATNDTNVTVTLGGTPSTALLRAASLTLGWTGQLAVSRGGTGLSALGTANQLLRVNAGATALEYFTQTLGTISGVVLTTPSNGQVLQFNGTNWVNATPSGGGTITGSGTANSITKWTGTTAISNSTITDDGTTVTIGANLSVSNQVYSPVNAKGNSGTGTVNFNWNDGNIQTVTLTGNCTFAFSNPQSGAVYQIIITQDGTGGRTITWPTIHWEARTVPTLTGTLNSKDIVTFTYDGTNYNGVIVKNFGTP